MHGLMWTSTCALFSNWSRPFVERLLNRPKVEKIELRHLCCGAIPATMEWERESEMVNAYVMLCCSITDICWVDRGHSYLCRMRTRCPSIVLKRAPFYKLHKNNNKWQNEKNRKNSMKGPQQKAYTTRTMRGQNRNLLVRSPRSSAKARFQNAWLSCVCMACNIR